MSAHERAAGRRTASLFIDGIAFWAPTLPGWDAARAAFRGEREPLATPAKRPAPEILAPAERRRAPDTVALALEVAAAAVRESGLDAATLPSIFTSAHGDLAINDYMCTTLASAPTLISPTKFHNSVHNAAAGYWTIATGCHEASTALTRLRRELRRRPARGGEPVPGRRATGAAGRLRRRGDRRARVGDRRAPACSPARSCCRRSASERTRRGVRLVARERRRRGAAPIRSPAARSLAGNAMAGALPLLEAIADGRAGRGAGSITLPLARSLALALVVRAGSRPRPRAAS